MEEIKLILASASPRRHELLCTAGLSHEIIVSDADESAADTLASEQFASMPRAVRYAAEASRLKGSAVARGLSVEDGVRCFVISADTVVSSDLEEVLGKPSGREGAREMLRSLSGRKHYVIGGLTVTELGGRAVTRTVTTEVTFAELGEAELEAYLSTDEPYDKAGAYGIQGRGAMLVSGICGDYANVVGLSVFTLKNILTEDFGVAAERLIG